MQALYNCKPEANNHYRITKFDSDLNPTSSYILTEENCECPQAHARSCRHRKMLPMFKREGHIADGYFFVWETHQWYRPTGIFAQGTEEQRVIVEEPSEGGKAPVSPPPAMPVSAPPSVQPSPKKATYRRY